MTNLIFKPPADAVIDDIIRQARFDGNGLLATIAQSASAPHEVLMLAWMNAEALQETLSTGRVCYYSRSRKALWRKGETSGQIQTLVSAALDCDRDALLLHVHQKGVACHTGRRSCFYNAITPEGIMENSAPLIDASQLYSKGRAPETS